MHTKKRGFIVLVSLMVLSASAFSEGQRERTNQGGDDDTVYSYRMMRNFWGSRVPDPEGYWEQHVEERFNVELEIEWIPTPELNRKRQVIISSGDAPELLMTWADTEYKEQIEQGVWLRLDEHFAGFPNLRDHYLSEWDTLKSSGLVLNEGLYGFGAMGFSNSVMMSARGDWMERLGIEEPTTIDEFYDMLYAFTYDDPDGNGVDDTYGLAVDNGLGTWYRTRSVYDMFNVPFSSMVWSIYDGEAYTLFNHPNLKQFVTFMARAWADGVIEPMSPTLQHNRSLDLFWSGSVGTGGTQINAVGVGPRLQEDTSPVVANTFERRGNQDPGADQIYLDEIQSLNGRPNLTRMRAINYIHVLYAPHFEDQGKIDRFMSILDWRLSDEGRLFSSWGPEGVTWDGVQPQGNPNLIFSEEAEDYLFDAYAWIYVRALISRKPGTPADDFPYFHPNWFRDPTALTVNQQATEMLERLSTAEEQGHYGTDGTIMRQLTNPYFIERSPDITEAVHRLIVETTVGSVSLDDFDAELEAILDRYDADSYVEATRQEIRNLGYLD